MQLPTQFTLRDLMVAVVVVALLLLLPARWVMKGLEAARRNDCRMNLKQLGVALHNYHDAYKRLPPAFFTASGPDVRRGHLNGITAALPFIESNWIYNSLNFKFAWTHASNTTSVSPQLGYFLCPENRTAGQITDAGLLAGATDYGFCKGAAAFLCEGPHRPDYPAELQGMFDVNSGVRFKDVTDGTAFTFMAGEIAGGAKFGGVRYDGKLFTVDQAWAKASIDDSTVPSFGGMGSILAVVLQNPAGKKWPLQKPADGVPAPLNARPITIPHDASLDASCTNVADRVNEFRSAHRGGAHFLMGDGTVRFISNEIDGRVYMYLGTIRGKDIVEVERF